MGLFGFGLSGRLHPSPKPESADYETINNEAMRSKQKPRSVPFLRWAIYALMAVAMACIFRAITAVSHDCCFLSATGLAGWLTDARTANL
jgi:hypothetical protein